MKLTIEVDDIDMARTMLMRDKARDGITVWLPSDSGKVLKQVFIRDIREVESDGYQR